MGNKYIYGMPVGDLFDEERAAQWAGAFTMLYPDYSFRVVPLPLTYLAVPWLHKVTVYYKGKSLWSVQYNQQIFPMLKFLEGGDMELAYQSLRFIMRLMACTP